MRFRVSRTSVWSDEDPNIKGAYSLPNGPDCGYKQYWYVDINSLEDLLTFCKESEHQVVLNDKDFLDFDGPSLEVYDDYRE